MAGQIINFLQHPQVLELIAWLQHYQYQAVNVQHADN